MKKKICIPKDAVHKLVIAIRSGKIDLGDFTKSTEHRIKVLEKYVGSNVEEINLEIERKLLNKDTGLAVANFIRGLANVPIKEQESRIKAYNERIDRLFNPTSENTFLKALVHDSIGVEATFEETKLLKELTDQANEAKGKIVTTVQDIREMGQEIIDMDIKGLSAEQQLVVASIKKKIIEAQEYELEKDTQERIKEKEEIIKKLESGEELETKERKPVDPRIKELNDKISALKNESKKEEAILNKVAKLEQELQDTINGIEKEKETKERKPVDPRIKELNDRIAKIKALKVLNNRHKQKLWNLKNKLASIELNGLPEKTTSIQKEKHPEILAIEKQIAEASAPLKEIRKTQSTILKLQKQKKDIEDGIVKERVIKQETNPEILALREEIKELKRQDLSKKYSKLIGELLGGGNIPVDIEVAIRNSRISKNRLEYAVAIQNIEEFITGVSTKNLYKKFRSVSEMKEYLMNRKGWVLTDSISALKALLAMTRATADFSFALIQGMYTTINHPIIASRVLWKATKAFGKQTWYGVFGTGKEVMRDNAIQLYMRDNYINGNYKTAGFNLNRYTAENIDAFNIDDLPVLKQIIKPFNVTFEVYMSQIRAEIFDMLVANHKGELTKDHLKDYGKISGTLTMRADTAAWGYGGVADAFKGFFWSPGMLTASYNLITAHSLGTGLNTKEAKIKAAKNLAISAGVLITLGILLNAAGDGDDDWKVGLDPRSSDFLKLVRGDIRQGFGGPAAAMVVLISRILTNSFKDTNGKVTSLNTFGLEKNFLTGEDLKKGQHTAWSSFMRFVRYKASPLPNLGASALGWYSGFEDQETVSPFEPDSFAHKVWQNSIMLSLQSTFEIMALDEEAWEKSLSITLQTLGIPFANYQR
jgi:hypothetical protein